MITTWLPYEYHMITIWLPYDYHMITIWLPYDYHNLRVSCWANIAVASAMFWRVPSSLNLVAWRLDRCVGVVGFTATKNCGSCWIPSHLMIRGWFRGYPMHHMQSICTIHMLSSKPSAQHARCFVVWVLLQSYRRKDKKEWVNVNGLVEGRNDRKRMETLVFDHQYMDVL